MFHCLNSFLSTIYLYEANTNAHESKICALFVRVKLLLYMSLQGTLLDQRQT